MPNKTRPRKLRTKKVFRMWKYISCTNTMDKSSCEIAADAFRLGWPQRCEGKTVEEIMANPKTSYLMIPDIWLVEETY